MKKFTFKNKSPHTPDVDSVSPQKTPETKAEGAKASNTSTVQFAELPLKNITISPQRRIVELNDEIRQLTCELEYYKNLTDDVLLRILPIILYHSTGLYTTVQKCHASIEKANSERVQFWK
jgi:hypothetical protein